MASKRKYAKLGISAIFVESIEEVADNAPNWFIKSIDTDWIQYDLNSPLSRAIIQHGPRADPITDRGSAAGFSAGFSAGLSAGFSAGFHSHIGNSQESQAMTGNPAKSRRATRVTFGISKHLDALFLFRARPVNLKESHHHPLSSPPFPSTTQKNPKKIPKKSQKNPKKSQKKSKKEKKMASNAGISQPSKFNRDCASLSVGSGVAQCFLCGASGGLPAVLVNSITLFTRTVAGGGERNKQTKKKKARKWNRNVGRTG